MKGLASHTATSCQAHQPDALDISLRLHYPPAPVSIGAKPLSPHFANRSSTMPIALRRPIRKVSFSDLTTLDQSAGSDSKPAPCRHFCPETVTAFQDHTLSKMPSSTAFPLPQVTAYTVKAVKQMRAKSEAATSLTQRTLSLPVIRSVSLARHSQELLTAQLLAHHKPQLEVSMSSSQ